MGSFVFDLDEEEAGGGSGGSGGGAVAGGEDGGNGVGRETSGAGFDEGSDEVADHVMKEAVAGDSVDEEALVVRARRIGGWCGWWSSCGNPRPEIRTWGTRFVFSGAGGEVGIDGGEGGEVVGAEDVGGGLLEGGEIERRRAGPDEGASIGEQMLPVGWMRYS